jgi:hypothetical protein
LDICDANANAAAIRIFFTFNEAVSYASGNLDIPKQP